ncbi:MAG TPA: META domain-containing protein [Gemmatimonadaceae bacterium]|jgi:heat shock protein HslJ
MRVESFEAVRGTRVRSRFVGVRSAVVTAIVVATVTVSGCVAGWRSPKPPPPPNIGTSQWHLVQFNHLAAVPANMAQRPWLQFDDKTKHFDGSGGCNRLSGPFTRTDTYLHFGNTVSTAMACSDAAVNQQEADFKAALRNVDRYWLNGDTLTLGVGADAVAMFTR